jgi:DNA repair protein RecN (Recombination protein N)
MIKSVVIKNYILAENIVIDFSKGLQIITGETGAGKSILIGAIDIVFGKSVDNGILKDKSKPVYLEVSCEQNIQNETFKDLLKKNEIENADEDVFFIREIFPNGRSKSFLNGRRVSLAIMKEFREAIFDFHSQRDQLLLLNRNYQLEMIDKYGKLLAFRDDYQTFHKELRKKSDELSTLRKEELENQERQQLFSYQLQELEQLHLAIGEDDDLQRELNLLEHAEEILILSQEMEQAIYECDNSVYDQINQFLHRLSKFRADNNEIKSATETIQEALQNLDESVSRLRNVRDSIELDEERQIFVEERLNDLNKVKQKYKMSLAELIDYQHEITKKMEQHSSLEKKISETEKDVVILRKKVWEKADLLSIKRLETAKKFQTEIQENLKKLAIPYAKVDIKFDRITGEKDFIQKLAEMSFSGNDSVEIYFSANPGTQLETLENAASGGELSRFLLTIKKLISDKMDSKIIIFDEIDTGIGGRTAEFMGDFIHSIARHHQVICLTHLAAVASFGDEHFLVEKEVSQNRTEIRFKKLRETEKKRELARMISGESSEHALKYADEILKNKMAGKEKKRND